MRSETRMRRQTMFSRKKREYREIVRKTRIENIYTDFKSTQQHCNAKLDLAGTSRGTRFKFNILSDLERRAYYNAGGKADIAIFKNMEFVNMHTLADETHQVHYKVSLRPIIHLFCVPTDLHLLSKFPWNLDGTFKLVCALKIVAADGSTKKKFQQVYIGAINYKVGHKRHWYPVFYAVMGTRTQAAYNKLFKFINNLYKKHNPDAPPLIPPKIIMDYEMAPINSIKSVYGQNVPFRLCRVHFLRNVKKKMVTEVCGTFWSDPGLSEFWKIIKGSVFLPWVKCDFLIPILFSHLEKDVLKNVLKENQKGYKDLIKYVKTEYFTQTKKSGKNNEWGPSSWDHNTDVVNFGDVDGTSNLSESINSNFNRTANTSHQTDYSIFSHIYIHMGQEWEKKLERVTANRMHSQSICIIQDHQRIHQIVLDFDDLLQYEQESSLISYCLKLSDFNSRLDDYKQRSDNSDLTKN